MIYYFLMLNGELKKLSEFDSYEISEIRKEICRKEELPEEAMILLASGGLFLQDGLLDDFSCGEDHNPIYVFIKQSAKLNLRTATEFVVVGECIQLEELLGQIDTLLGRKRIELRPKQWLNEVDHISSRLIELGKQLQYKKIEAGIKAQHLLINGGWATALANLADSVSTAEQKLKSAMSLRDKLQNEFETENDPRKVLSHDRENKSREILSKIPLPLDSSNNLLEWINQRDNETFPGSSINSMILQARTSLQDLIGTTLKESTSLCYPGAKEGLLSKMEQYIELGIKLIEYGKPNEYNQDTHRPKSSDKQKNRTDMGSLCKRLEDLAEKQDEGSKLLQSLQTYRDFIQNTVRQLSFDMPAILEDHVLSAEKHLEQAKSQIKALSEIARIVSDSHEAVLNHVNENVKWLELFETQLTGNDNNIFLVRQKIKHVRAGVEAMYQLESAPELFIKSIVALSQHTTALQVWTNWGFSSSKIADSIRKEHGQRRLHICELLKSHFLKGLLQPMLNYNLPKFGSNLLSSHEDLVKTLSCLPTANLTPEYFKNLFNQIQNMDNVKILNAQNIDTLNPLESPEELVARHSTTNRVLLPVEVDINLDKQAISPALSLSSPTDIISLIPPPQDVSDDEGNKMGSEEVDGVRDDNDDADSHSSKLFQSINSTDFQNYTERCIQTEHNKLQYHEVFTVVDTLHEDLISLKGALKEVKTQATSGLHELESEFQSHHNSVNDLFVKLKNQLDLEEKNKVKKVSVEDSSTDMSDFQKYSQTSVQQQSVSDSLIPTHDQQKKVGLVLRNFEKNDPVLFQIFQPTSSSSTKHANRHQWIMLSSDGRYYFLHDDCFPHATKTNIRHHSNSCSQSNPITHDESCTIFMEKSYTATSTEISVQASADDTMTLQSHNKPNCPSSVTICASGCIVKHVVSGIYRYKEEYIAKKKSNRYGLPENTRFFRVYASVDWSSAEPALGEPIETSDKPIRIKNPTPR